MTQKLIDPCSFLRNLVTKKGKSDLYGVYLPNVTITAEASEDYGYTRDKVVAEKLVRQFQEREESAWNRLLVETRMNKVDVVHPLAFTRGQEPVTIYFILEGNELSAMVFIPTVVVDEFPCEVEFYQLLLRQVASFSEKNAGSLRFTIGAASIGWDDLVTAGRAQEVDVGF
jgi:hypothetical protein